MSRSLNGDCASGPLKGAGIIKPNALSHVIIFKLAFLVNYVLIAEIDYDLGLSVYPLTHLISAC